MKKYITAILLIMAVALNAYPSEDAQHALRSSSLYLESSSIEKHEVAVRKLKASLAFPDITPREREEVGRHIAIHNEKIAKLKSSANKKVPSNQTAYSPNRKTPGQKVQEEIQQTTAPVIEAPKRNKPLKINDIVFTNELRGDIISEQPFYAPDMRYLYAQVFYDGPSDEIEKRIYVKIYDPRGNLMRFNDLEDYTFTQRVTFYPYDDMENYLAGTGNSQKSIFIPGNYRYEMWIDGQCMASKDVTIGMRSGERFTGDAEFKSLTANPKNYSVSFDVTMAARNMQDKTLTVRISFLDPATGKNVEMPGGGNAMVERSESILYDEAVLSFSMNIPYSKFNIKKGEDVTLNYVAEIVTPEGVVIATSRPGSFTFKQN